MRSNQSLPRRHLPDWIFNEIRAKSCGMCSALIVDLLEDGLSACTGPVNLEFPRGIQGHGSPGIILRHAQIEHGAVQSALGIGAEQIVVEALLRLGWVLDARGTSRQQTKCCRGSIPVGSGN